MQSLSFRLPLVESSRDTNGGGCWMSELKTNGHELWAGAADVVMVMIVFHSCELTWFLWQNSFTEHFGYDKDDEGSKKASASQEVYQRVTSSGKHG